MEINKKETKPHSHGGHRERVKKTVLKNGFKQLYDHELLEFLLFYAIPRRDTNPLAHQLIEQFGSLKNVMDADVDQLISSDGLGESCALYIKAIQEAMIRYVNSSEGAVYRYDRLEKVCRYLCNYYIGITKEKTIAMLFDNKMKLLDVVDFGEGTPNASTLNLYALVEAVMKKEAAGVILAHNHPGGLLEPSFEDGLLTRKVFDFLKQLSVPLIEHIIISENQAYPIIHYSKFYDVESVSSDRFGESFIHEFFQMKKEE